MLLNPKVIMGSPYSRGEIPVVQSGVKSQRIVAESMRQIRSRGIEQSTSRFSTATKERSTGLAWTTS